MGNSITGHRIAGRVIPPITVRYEGITTVRHGKCITVLRIVSSATTVIPTIRGGLWFVGERFHLQVGWFTPVDKKSPV